MSDSVSITDMLVNQISHASGVEDPRFSWKISSPRQGAAQTAFRLRVFDGRSCAGQPVFDCGETVSPSMGPVKFPGLALKPARAYSWRVSVRDETGAWTESAPAVFETGLFDAGAWDRAKWISAPCPRSSDNDTSAFLKKVANARDVREAWWFVTGLGVFEAYVNGRPVSHLMPDGTEVRDALKPGFTHAYKRRHYFSYDITHLVRREAGAANVFTALSSGGWWRDQITGHRGKESAFRGVLILRYADGSEESVATDETWLAGYFGPVTKADIFYGEDYDARAAKGWRALQAGEAEPDRAWKPARVNDEFSGETVPLKGLPVRWRDDLAIEPAAIRVWSGIEGPDDTHFGRVRIVREYRAGDEIRLYPGENLLVDFGQNAAAVPDFVFKAAPETRLTVRVAEMLNDCNGAFDRNNDGPEGELYKKNYRGARSEAHYIFSGEGEERYRPEFTFFGYRYMSLSANGVVTVKGIRSVPVTSVACEAETGCVSTALPLVNRLVENGFWGQRSNYLSVPTDCPQRNERLGWAADTQVFTPTACYNANVYSFLDKWMDDMCDTQGDNGGFPGVAPIAQYGSDILGAVGWADAGIIVPHVIWRMFGDTTVIEDHFGPMCKYIDFIDGQEGPCPSPWGEWLAYERNDPEIMRYLSGAFWVWDAMMMREMAAAIGRTDAVARFAESEARARVSFKAKFMGADGLILPEFRCQAADLYALFLDLVEGAAAEATKRDLLDNIKAHGDCLQTGFLGTAIIMDTLTKVGAVDVAYTLLLQRKNPSWLYSIDQGATTFWERWNSYTKESGFGDAGMNSFNHYAYGAVVSWLYSTAAGISADPAHPGFGHFILRPRPDARLGSIRAKFNSPAGVIESAWEYGRDGACTWRYAIPAGASATVVLPDGTSSEAAAGRYEARLA